MRNTIIIFFIFITISCLTTQDSEISIEPNQCSTGEIYRLNPYPVTTVSTRVKKNIYLYRGLDEVLSNATVIVEYQGGRKSLNITDTYGGISVDLKKRILSIIVVDSGEVISKAENSFPEDDENRLMMFIDSYSFPLYIDLKYFPADTYLFIF